MNFRNFGRIVLFVILVVVLGLAIGFIWQAVKSKSAHAPIKYATVTLHEAHAYMASLALPEKPNNNNLFYPEYDAWYRQQMPSIFSALWKRMSFSPWNPANYEALFQAVIQQLTQQRVCKNNVVQLKFQPGDSIIIMGDLQGSFESCINDLYELKKLGIIGNDLKLKNQHYHLIFNANVIGREPLNLELLAVVSSLMLKNPEHVWYVRGAYEEAAWWQYGVLGEQLDLLKKEGQKLKTTLESMLGLMPYALYINYEQGNKLIRISGYGREYKPLNERMFGNFFTQPIAGSHKYYCLSTLVPAQQFPHVKATVYSNDGVEEFVESKGLALLDFTGGSIAWSVFSAPTHLHRLINDFHYDAFAIIELGKTFEESAINLYSKDLNDKKPFALIERYVLQTGQPIGLHEKVVPQAQHILLGSSVDLSKGASVNGRALKTGLSVCINNYNHDIQKGKMPIQLIVRDNEYAPTATRTSVEELRSEGIDMIIALHGSPTLRSVMDYLEKGSMLFLFPTSGATVFRSPNLPGVIHFKSSYREQTFALIPQIIEQQFVKRFTLFYQDDSFGMSAIEAAREILPFYGIKEWTEIPYVRNITDMKLAAEKIKQSQPEALGLFSTASATIELLKAMGTDTAMHIKLFGIDTLSESLFVKFANKNGLNPLLCHSVPDPDTSTLPIVQEYRKAMTAAGKATGDFSLEAFIDASLFVYAIQHMQGPINHITVRNFFEQIKDVDFKGLHLNFDPVTRSLCHDVWVGDGTGPLVQKTAPEIIFSKKHFKP